MSKYNKLLYGYIKNNLEKGYSREKLEKTLLDKGYDQAFLNEIFMDIELKGNRGFLGIFPKKLRFELKDDTKPEYQPTVITNPEKKGLSQRVEEINEKVDLLTKVDIEKKNKHFELPRKIKRQLKKLAEKNKVLVILRRTNRNVEPIITDIKDGFISINGVPHHCSMDFIYLWKGKYPCIDLNEWDLIPIGTKDYYDAVDNKRLAYPVSVVMRMIKSGESLMVKPKMQFSKGVIIAVVIIVIAAAYIFLGGGK